MKKEKDFIKDILWKRLKYNVRGNYKTKFLVPDDLTVSQFSFMNRKRIEREKEVAFFLLHNRKHLIAGDARFPNPHSPIANSI